MIALSLFYPVSRPHFIALAFYTINVGFQSLSHSIKPPIKTVDLVDPALSCVAGVRALQRALRGRTGESNAR